MVKGLETFRDFFADYRDCYVIIGGSACDLYFAEQDLPFRVTHDIDMILCVESLTPAFFNRFWEFIRAGGYVNRQRSDGRPQFYRFSKPTVAGFPAMLELFSRKADYLPDDGTAHLTPVPAGEEASSLSAILLDRACYEFVMANRREAEGVTVLAPIALIVLKAIAWLDLSAKRAAGDKAVSSHDIGKHKNDIARLTATIGVRDYALPDAIKERMRGFLAQYATTDIDVSALGVAIDADEIRQRLTLCFGLDRTGGKT